PADHHYATRAGYERLLGSPSQRPAVIAQRARGSAIVRGPGWEYDTRTLVDHPPVVQSGTELGVPGVIRGKLLVHECVGRKECAMTVARSLAAFLTQVSYAELPPQTVEHAAMLIASTIASAAMGSGLASSAIIRALARERGGKPEASLWFDTGPKLPVA